jgi:protein arginine phosphatase
MLSILFVCAANICRSPMAEALLKRLITGRPDAGEWHIESAGIWGVEGYPAAETSQLVMKAMGMDLSMHKSQPVSYELLKQFDLILTMEVFHKECLAIEYDGFKDRIYTISEMVDSTEDIHDPMGGKPEAYEATAHKLEQILSDGLERIVQLALSHQKSALDE